jgi:hypothetical protein
MTALSHLCCFFYAISEFAAASYDCEDDQCSANSSISLLQSKFQLVTHSEEETVNYFPEHDVIVHACAKCGSTTLYTFIFKEIFGQDKDCSAALQVVNSCWNGEMIAISLDEAATRNADPEGFSFGLIRDPNERIISAWKSKAACPTHCFTIDCEDRSRYVPELLALAGSTSNATCLSWSDFLDVLLSVHNQGKAQELNAHFQPQHLAPAFQKIPLEKWDMLAKVTCDNCAEVLAEHLGDKNATGAVFPLSHASNRSQQGLSYTLKKLQGQPTGPVDCPNGGLEETDATKKKLALVTKSEYEALGPYL